MIKLQVWFWASWQPENSWYHLYSYKKQQFFEKNEAISNSDFLKEFLTKQKYHKSKYNNKSSNIIIYSKLLCGKHQATIYFFSLNSTKGR